MTIQTKFASLMIAAAMVGSAPVIAAPSMAMNGATVERSSSDSKPVLLAQAGRKKRAKKGGAAAKRGVREKIISREARQKGSDSRNIDFDAADIGGARKTPLGTLINQNKADKNYDFVKIRLRWHPEMVQSASSLETGTTK